MSSGKPWNSSGGVPLPLAAVQMTSLGSSVMVPSSVLIGLASFWLTTWALHPGTGSGCNSVMPGGTFMSTLTVFASLVSFGTRTWTVGPDPVGSVLGCRLTCACAVVGTARAMTAAAAAGSLRKGVLPEWIT